MVSAIDLLKKAEAKRSKNPSKFKAVQRRAWDYVEPEPINVPEEKIWEQNKEQIGNEYKTSSTQIWEQNENEIGNKKEHIWEQNRIESSNENVNKSSPITRQQNVHETLLDDVAQKRVLTLSGHQKEVMRHITSHLKSRVGHSYTVDILPSILANKIKADLEVTRVVLKRLVEKCLLVRLPGERGRNGCCKFKVPENVVKMCFSFFNDIPCDINQIGSEIGNINRNNISYSSSNNINTTTSLPENWEQIDISALSSIGFSKTQINQLFEKSLNTPEVIQESINHFAFGLENNPKIKSYPDPLNVLMGVLRKGGAWIEKNYVSPRDLAIRQLLEEKRKQNEQREAMIKELADLEFPEWRKKLTEEQIKQIVPSETLKLNIGAAITAALRTHFLEQVLMPRFE